MEPRKPNILWFLLAIIAVVAIFRGVPYRTSGEPSVPAPPKKTDGECRQDLDCWAKRHEAAAMTDCQRQIDRRAKYDTRWDSGWLTPMFTRINWSNRDAGRLTYIGDKVKFQNGFGAWAPMIYACDYDPEAKAVLDVRVREGRLPD